VTKGEGLWGRAGGGEGVLGFQQGWGQADPVCGGWGEFLVQGAKGEMISFLLRMETGRDAFVSLVFFFFFSCGVRQGWVHILFFFFFLFLVG